MNLALFGPPGWLWLCLFAVPLIETIRRPHRVSAVGATTILLMITAYGLGFATFHGAGTEPIRHMLTATFYYRLVVAFSIVALLPSLVPLAGGWVARLRRAPSSDPAPDSETDR